jgi:hypothetical protein
VARPTIDALSQTELIAELKRWIDTARFSSPGGSTEVSAVNRVLDLVRSNSTSAQRPHVLHNLGCVRRRWLRQVATTMPPGSLADTIRSMGCGR